MTVHCMPNLDAKQSVVDVSRELICAWADANAAEIWLRGFAALILLLFLHRRLTLFHPTGLDGLARAAKGKCP